MNNQAFWYINGDPLNGMWIDMDNIDNTDEVLEILADNNYIPRDEETDEPVYEGDLLVADAEGLCLPFMGLYGCFDLSEFTDCRDHHGDEDAKIAYVEWAGSWSADNFEDSYQGQYNTDEAFAEELADQIGAIDRDLHWPHTCIDWEWAARELMCDYVESNGHYFRNC